MAPLAGRGSGSLRGLSDALARRCPVSCGLRGRRGVARPNGLRPACRCRVVVVVGRCDLFGDAVSIGLVLDFSSEVVQPLALVRPSPWT